VVLRFTCTLADGSAYNTSDRSLTLNGASYANATLSSRQADWLLRSFTVVSTVRPNSVVVDATVWELRSGAGAQQHRLALRVEGRRYVLRYGTVLESSSASRVAPGPVALAGTRVTLIVRCMRLQVLCVLS